MNIPDYFDAAASSFATRVAVVDSDRSYTYRELRHKVSLMSATLERAGVMPGSKVALYSQNSVETIAAFLAVIELGGVWVSVELRSARALVVERLRTVGIDWLIYDESMSSEDLLDSAPHCMELEKLRAASLVNGPLDNGPTVLKVGGSGMSPVAMATTGGTSGWSKWVIYNQFCWVSYVEWYRSKWPKHREPVVLLLTPVCYRAGFELIAQLSIGATCVLLDGIGPRAILEAIHRYRVTHLSLVPTLLYSLLAQADVGRYDYSTLVMVLLRAAPVSPERLADAVRVFGPCVCQSYGQIEAGVLSWFEAGEIADALRDCPERLLSCGKACSSVRLEVVGLDGELLPCGETGELIVRGVTVAERVGLDPIGWEQADATSNRHQELAAAGWHYTGDVGRVDEDGYIYIVDRVRDVIVTAGYNVYSVEVEATVSSMPGVSHCAVVGVPDSILGEAVMAFVVPSGEPSVTERDVREWCKGALGRVRTPLIVEFREALPLTVLGKVDKKSLRQPFWKDKRRQVH